MKEYDGNTYIFTMTACDSTKVRYTGNKETIYEVLEDFKSFLKGCGYSSSCVDSIQITDEE